MQIKYEDRLLFLREFTKEIIINSKSSEIPEKAEAGTLEMEEAVGKAELPAYEIMVPSMLEEKPEKEEKKPELKPALPLTKPQLIPKTRYRLKPIQITKPKIVQFQRIKPQIQPQPTPQPQFPPQIQPQFVPSQMLDLGNLNFLVSDPRVTVIECPGPGKFVLAKALGEVKVTQSSLTQEEISSIIQKFSQAAKIPVISGLFKAAVGNLVITAVISDLVGSRFIITKMTPRFMLEQGNLS